MVKGKFAPFRLGLRLECCSGKHTSSGSEMIVIDQAAADGKKACQRRHNDVCFKWSVTAMCPLAFFRAVPTASLPSVCCANMDAHPAHGASAMSYRQQASSPAVGETSQRSVG